MRPINETTLMEANLRGVQRQSQFAIAVSARYDRRIARVVVTLSSSLQIAFTPRSTQGLECALPTELMDIEVTPSGLGVHFPKIDADVYLPALLEGCLGTRSWMSSLGGERTMSKFTSVAKAAAARENGKLGGRPRRGRVAGTRNPPAQADRVVAAKKSNTKASKKA